MLGGLYSDSGFAATDSVFAHWNFGSFDPLHKKAAALVDFCFPAPSKLIPGSNAAHGYDALKGLLSADNLKHFLELYKHYQNHWPMIHASLDLFNAHDGLILTMVCIGAVYSERVGVKEVRWLMEMVRASVLRSSQLYKQASERARGVVEQSMPFVGNLQEVQALVHIHSLFVWHGNQKQRQQAREDFWILANIVQQLGLLRPFPSGHLNASALHQPGPMNMSDVTAWSWTRWLEQETRIRVMHLVFLIDASLAIFFNAKPQLDIFDIQLPLPADDASWEAKSAEDCANALGLRGDAAQANNHAGTRRAKQLIMSEVLVMLHQGHNLPHRATNVYSKFILIHAIHVQIFQLQRQLCSATGLSSSGASTPQSHEGTASGGSSGAVTPTDGGQYSQPQGLLRSTMCALMLWKKQWDSDMQLQYGTKQRPLGFCRDGIHFYFLAKIFLQNSRREDWTATPDDRFQQVFNQLKYIRTHVASDSSSKNLDTGSVTTINDEYGLAGLTLNMKLLFTPIYDTPTNRR